MSKLLFMAAAIVTLLTGCGKTAEKLRFKIDSLNSELSVRDGYMQKLQEVGTLIDSIDASRGNLLLDLNKGEGVPRDDYSKRLNSISSYVKNTQKKLDDLEASLSKSIKSNASYAASIAKLKQQLVSKNKEVEDLKAVVTDLESKNKSLVSSLDVQAVEIADKDEKIVAKQKELEMIEARIQELMRVGKLNEGESYYMQAFAQEEVARRTQFAPRKKKAALEQALELYRKSLSLGKTEAEAKIAEIEKKLK